MIAIEKKALLSSECIVKVKFSYEIECLLALQWGSSSEMCLDIDALSFACIALHFNFHPSQKP